MRTLISVIIPAYNEQSSILNCLKSLKNQSYRNIEIILVDDGSTDNTREIISNFKSTFRLETRSRRAISNLKLLCQKHQGPGTARNLGAKYSKAEILVFVDADMTFDENFIKDLTKPIINGETIGTFSKNEMVANSDNIWSICWNINRNVPIDRMLASDYPNKAPVFRAILKKEFEKVGGFDETGEYIDDWSLSRKLGKKSTEVLGAIYYHSNPDNLLEMWEQARWIGKNEFLAGSNLRKIRSLILYSIPFSLLIGLYKAFIKKTWQFLPFKILYDLAVWISVLRSFLGQPKYK